MGVRSTYHSGIFTVVRNLFSGKLNMERPLILIIDLIQDKKQYAARLLCPGNSMWIMGVGAQLIAVRCCA